MRLGYELYNSLRVELVALANTLRTRLRTNCDVISVLNVDGTSHDWYKSYTLPSAHHHRFVFRPCSWPQFMSSFMSTHFTMNSSFRTIEICLTSRLDSTRQIQPDGRVHGCTLYTHARTFDYRDRSRILSRNRLRPYTLITRVDRRTGRTRTVQNHPTRRVEKWICVYVGTDFPRQRYVCVHAYFNTIVIYVRAYDDRYIGRHLNEWVHYDDYVTDITLVCPRSIPSQIRFTWLPLTDGNRAQIGTIIFVYVSF